jgi:hypothetical protein
MSIATSSPCSFTTLKQAITSERTPCSQRPRLQPSTKCCNAVQHVATQYNMLQRSTTCRMTARAIAAHIRCWPLRSIVESERSHRTWRQRRRRTREIALPLSPYPTREYPTSIRRSPPWRARVLILVLDIQNRDRYGEGPISRVINGQALPTYLAPNIFAYLVPRWNTCPTSMPRDDPSVPAQPLAGVHR